MFMNQEIKCPECDGENYIDISDVNDLFGDLTCDHCGLNFSYEIEVNFDVTTSVEDN